MGCPIQEIKRVHRKFNLERISWGGGFFLHRNDIGEINFMYMKIILVCENINTHGYCHNSDYCHEVM